MRRLAHTTVAASLLLATLHLASAATAPAPTPTAAQARLPRHALVIGNSQYPKGPLLNPKNDAQAVADRLRQAGFSVTLKLDSGRRELQESIRQARGYLKELGFDLGLLSNTTAKPMEKLASIAKAKDCV